MRSAPSLVHETVASHPPNEPSAWCRLVIVCLLATAQMACEPSQEPLAPPIAPPTAASPAGLAQAGSLAATSPSHSDAKPGSSSKRTGPPLSATSRTDNLDVLGKAVPRELIPAQAAPFQLTSSDGTGLLLRSVDAKVVVDGPLAFTELHLTFDNPVARQIEGRFSITLPPGAGVSRFAMKTGGRWMEGEMVERQRARRIYEDYLHKRQDPALLEVDAGNRFRARVFPIPARGQKQLIIAWSQERTDPKAAYRLPLVGLPTLDQLRVQAWLYGRQGVPKRVSLHRSELQPAVDFELYPSALGRTVSGLRSGRVAMAQITATADTEPSRHEHAWLLIDTSASTIRYQGATLALLARMGEVLASAGVGRVSVVAFDQTAERIWEGAPSQIGDAKKLLMNRGAMGASDLGNALAQVAKLSTSKVPSRLIIVSDGVVTAGLREPDALRERVRTLNSRHIARVDAVSVASARDEPLLTSLVQGQLNEDGVFIRPGADGAGLERLAQSTKAPIQVAVPGAKWVWPRTIVGLQAGQSALVWAELPADAPFSVKLTGGIERTVVPTTRAAMAPLLERAWVQARIAMLSAAHQAGNPGARARLKLQAVALSVRHRVLSPWTALLVLENDRELRRYGISPTSAANILTITGDGRAARLSRRALYRRWHRDESHIHSQLHRANDKTKKLGGKYKASRRPRSQNKDIAAALDSEVARKEGPSQRAQPSEPGQRRRPLARLAPGGFAEDADAPAREPSAGQAVTRPPAPSPDAAEPEEKPARRPAATPTPSRSGSALANNRPVAGVRQRRADAGRFMGDAANVAVPLAKAAEAQPAAELEIGRRSGGMGFRRVGSGGGGTGHGIGSLRGLGNISTGSGSGTARRARIARRSPPSFPRVRTTSVRTAGPMTPSQARRVLRHRANRLARCAYGIASGWAKSIFLVGPNGRVEEISSVRGS
ncbi:MAG: hypothetical protein KC502_04390, partial [Myxococcales bacterium]|nr:hypothetical protein [Myxococcales bacterium]